jgi:integrase
MKRAQSGNRGVFWRANPRGSQEAKRPDGVRERGDWWVRWTCPHGHLHRERVGQKSLANKKVEGKRIDRPCPRRTVKPAHYLLADVINEYLAATKALKHSWKDDARHGKVWSARFSGRTLDEITPGELERIRTERLLVTKMEDGTQRAVTPATVNREFAFLRRVYNVAIRDDKAASNPVSKLKTLREPSGRTRYLTDDEEGRLMKVLPADEDRERVIVLLQTGFRRSELLGLRWRDVDFKGGVLTIPQTKNGEARHVPMTSTVRTILSGRPRSLDGGALVFPNAEGHRDLRWAKKTVPGAFRAAQIKDFRFHDLRHSFASRLAMEGVDLLTIRDLMGHKTMAMTLRYSHLSPGHRRTAVERLVTRPMTAESSPMARAE